MAEDTTAESPFHAMNDEKENPPLDDFFDTRATSSVHHYNLDSERFIFDGDEEDVVVSPGSLRHTFSGSTNEPLLPGYHISGGFQLGNDDDDNWSDDHPLALPIARLERQYPRHELSGINYLNLCTFIVHVTISILFGSGILQWLPSPWTVTTQPAYETLLTPSQWAGDYLWIPALSLEGIFTMVQLMPSVRARTEVVEGVGYYWFYIGMLQSLATVFFCLKWIIPAWIALVINSGFLLLLHLRLKQHHALNSDYKSWKLWIFRFPFDFHLGWLLPLLAARASMIFRHYGSHDVGLQLGADIVVMALLLPCAGVYLVKGKGPQDWVVPILILWAYFGIACRLMHTPEVLIDLYGKDIVAAVRGAAWCFAGSVSLLVAPKVVIWVAREFLTIRVVQLTEEDENDEEVEDLLMNDPRDTSAVGMTQF